MNISNGCGPDILGWQNKADFFAEECGQHDKDYTGGKSREQADQHFLTAMLKKCEQKPSGLRKTQAYLYWGLCRIFGRFFYRKR